MVLDRNWRSGRCEIDLVVRDGDVVAFVEVKARGPGPQSPLEALTAAQRRRIRRAAEAWIHAHPGVGSEFRYDAVAVEYGPSPAGAREGPDAVRIRHVPDAWHGDP